MQKLSEEETITLIQELVEKGVTASALRKIGIDISSKSISFQRKLADKLLLAGFQKEKLIELGIQMERFPINDQMDLNTRDAKNKNQQAIAKALDFGREI